MDWIMYPFTWGFGSLLENLIVPLPHLLMKVSNSVWGHFENPGKWVQTGWPINHTQLQTYVTSPNLSSKKWYYLWTWIWNFHNPTLSPCLILNVVSFFPPSIAKLTTMPFCIFRCTLLQLIMIYRRTNDASHYCYYGVYVLMHDIWMHRNKMGNK